MDYQHLKIERDGAIATVTLNRPEKLNALSVDLLEEIGRLGDEFSEDAETRVARLKALEGKKVQLEGDPGHEGPWVRIVSVKTITVEIGDSSGRGAHERDAVEVVFREVAVGG